jgi:hypothetical protein
MKISLRSPFKFVSAVLVVFLLAMIAQKVAQTNAVGNMTLSKDTLSNSRPSVSTTLGAGVTAGDTAITLASSTGILAGDVITLAGGTPENLTVATVTDATHVATTTAAANAHSNATAVYDKQTSVHTFSFTTRSAVASGSFLITFPVAGSNQNDGVPDAVHQYDFNSLAGTDVSVTGFTAGTKTITASAGTVSIAFSSSIAASTAITITVGSTNKLLNPQKSASAGTADIDAIRVDEKDANGVVDTSSVDVGIIESELITVSVSPTLSFTIAGVASGQTAFGATNTNVTTTATTVPFGSISTATPYYAAQDLTVSTNAVSGYTVTGFEDGALRKTNGTTITDFSTTPGDNNGNDGFGYSGRSTSGTDCSVVYNTSGSFYSRGFGTSGTPGGVMTNAGPVSGSVCRVIYRVRVPATQAPGDYQNVVTYIATPSY